MVRRDEDRDPERAARVSSSEDPFDPSFSDLSDGQTEALRLPLPLGRTGSLMCSESLGMLERGRDPDLFCFPTGDTRDGATTFDEEAAGGATDAADRNLLFGRDVGVSRRARLAGFPRGSGSGTLRDLLGYARGDELAAVVAD